VFGAVDDLAAPSACRAFSATNHFAFSNETLNPFGGPYDHLVW
jgi:hypothetical protein